MIAVIAGATGLVGNELIQQLLEDPSVARVISLSRRSLQINNSKLIEVIHSDFSTLPSVQEQLKGDIYFCCLGTTIKKAGTKENFKKVDLDAVLSFARIAKRFEAKSFVVISAYGANSKSAIFYNKVKGQMEEELKRLHFTSLIIMHPSLLIGDRSELRVGEKIGIGAIKLIGPVLPRSIRKRAATDVKTLARKMLKVSMEGNNGTKIIGPTEI